MLNMDSGYFTLQFHLNVNKTETLYSKHILIIEKDWFEFFFSLVFLSQ